MNRNETFETAYRRYPFAPLVTLALEIAAWLKSRAASVQAKGRKVRSREARKGAVGQAA